MLVEEAVDGDKEVVFVVGGKEALTNRFDKSFELGGLAKQKRNFG